MVMSLFIFVFHKYFFKNIEFFYVFFILNQYIFYIFKLFWCIDIKNNFLKIKNIILIYF